MDLRQWQSQPSQHARAGPLRVKCGQCGLVRGSQNRKGPVQVRCSFHEGKVQFLSGLSSIANVYRNRAVPIHGSCAICCAGVMRVLSGQLKPKTCIGFVRVPFSLLYCLNKVFETQCVCKARARTVQVLHSLLHKIFKHYLKFSCKKSCAGTVRVLCNFLCRSYAGLRWAI